MGSLVSACGELGRAGRFEDANFEGLEGEGAVLIGVPVHRGEGGREGLRDGEGAALLRGELKGGSEVEVERLWLCGRIAEGDDPAVRAPRGPSINLQLAGIAADPVNILENGGVVAGPASGFGEDVPVGGGEEGWRDVHFLQLCAATEKGEDLVGEVVMGIGAEVFGLLREDHAVEHEGIEGE